jgi:HSP20 family protein
MADINVNNQSSGQSNTQNTEGRRGELQQQGSNAGLSRGGGRDPMGFSISPYEFLTSNPFTLMRRMSEEMDRMFGSVGESGTSRAGSWYPAIDITENNGQLQVHAELPGIKPEDIHVELANDILTIHGERKSEHQHQIGKAHRSERRYGQFYREIALPEGVNADQVKASFNHGVLEISVPVPQQTTNRRQIPIASANATGSSASGNAGNLTGSTSGAGQSSSGSGASSSSTSNNAAQAAASGAGGSATRSSSGGGSR